jgi:hypothetical protein
LGDRINFVAFGELSLALQRKGLVVATDLKKRTKLKVF